MNDHVVEELVIEVVAGQLMKVHDNELVGVSVEKVIDVAHQMSQRPGVAVTIVMHWELSKTFGFWLVGQTYVKYSGAVLELVVERIVLTRQPMARRAEKGVRGLPVAAGVVCAGQCQFEKRQAVDSGGRSHPLMITVLNVHCLNLH